MPDGWRMTSGVATVKMAGMTPNLQRTVAMDPELEAFIPLFPPADLTDPATARKNLAELAAAPLSASSPRRRSTCSPRPGVRRRPGLHHLRGIDG
jgi:hypothetical protein